MTEYFSTSTQQVIFITWELPTSIDNEGPVTIVSGPLVPLQPLQEGTTTIEYVFADQAGNTVSCLFNITIRGTFYHFNYFRDLESMGLINRLSMT